jgi:two-component system OmpR family sensor kinase
LTIVITELPGVQRFVPLPQASVLLALAAGSVAVTTGVLSAIYRRLSNEPRAVWLSVAFAVYGLVAVPVASVGTTIDHGGAGLAAGRLVAHLLVVMLLLVAVRPPRGSGSWQIRRLFAGCVAVTLVVGLSAMMARMGLSNYPPLRLAVAGGGMVAGTALTLFGWMSDQRPLFRVGLGVGVLSVAHGYKISQGGEAIAMPGLTFSSVRLLGLLVALTGMLQLVRMAVRAIHDAQAAHEEELRLKQLDLDRAAERDHELRNGLAGLAGATHLMGAHPQADETRTLRTAVSSELARLDAMMRAVDGGRELVESRHAYPLGPVLHDLVALRRCAGTDIRYDVETGLWAKGSPAVLTQVLTNVVANCARHAPGSPVRLQACRLGDRVRLRVSDFGPGVAPGVAPALFTRGARDASGGGLGLGLHICRRLLEAEGSSIEIRPGRPGKLGCTVVIELPAAGPLGDRTDPATASNSS